MVTHDLPYAFELCPRSVVLSDGVVVADGATADVLTDDALMSAHRLDCRSASIPARLVPPPPGNLRLMWPGPSGRMIEHPERGENVSPPRSRSTLVHPTRSRTRSRPRGSLAGDDRPAAPPVQPQTIAKREMASFKGFFVDPVTGPRKDNILKVVAGVGGVVVLAVVARKVSN